MSQSKGFPANLNVEQIRALYAFSAGLGVSDKDFILGKRIYLVKTAWDYMISNPVSNMHLLTEDVRFSIAYAVRECQTVGLLTNSEVESIINSVFSEEKHALQFSNREIFSKTQKLLEGATAHKQERPFLDQESLRKALDELAKNPKLSRDLEKIEKGFIKRLHARAAELGMAGISLADIREQYPQLNGRIKALDSLSINLPLSQKHQIFSKLLDITTLEASRNLDVKRGVKGNLDHLSAAIDSSWKAIAKLSGDVNSPEAKKNFVALHSAKPVRLAESAVEFEGRIQQRRGDFKGVSHSSSTSRSSKASTSSSQVSVDDMYRKHKEIFEFENPLHKSGDSISSAATGTTRSSVTSQAASTAGNKRSSVEATIEQVGLPKGAAGQRLLEAAQEARTRRGLNNSGKSSGVGVQLV